ALGRERRRRRRPRCSAPGAVLAARPAGGAVAREALAVAGAAGALRRGDDLPHRQPDPRRRGHRQSRPEGPFAPAAAGACDGIRRQRGVPPLVPLRRGLPAHLLLRLGRDGVGFLGAPPRPIAPPPFRAVAVAAAILYGAATG